MMETSAGIPALPEPLRWDPLPEQWGLTGPASFRASAGPRTDLFVDPNGSGAHANAPRLLMTPPPGDWMLSARIGIEFASVFDAGVLLVHAGDDCWAKVCFEFSPDLTPSVVSVVTKATSDDCNSFDVDGHQVWLRISKVGPAFAFHASHDARRWRLVRYFALGQDARVGFSPQSPTGEGIAVDFRDIHFDRATLADLRDGS